MLSAQSVIRKFSAFHQDDRVSKDFLIEYGFKGLLVSPQERKALSKVIEPFSTSTATKSKHFEKIPLSAMIEAMEKEGFMAIQEDGTKWSGFLAGREGNAVIPLAKKDDKDKYNPDLLKEVKNAALNLSWYKMESGKYEITAYI